MRCRAFFRAPKFDGPYWRYIRLASDYIGTPGKKNVTMGKECLDYSSLW
jgi:hypothetical protein